MGWESSGVVGFDLGPLVQGPNLKVLITHLLLVLEVWDGKVTYLLVWSGNHGLGI